ncbi:hypothetical protein Anapl_02015 [Anas platyrhynchos]|uniref:Uncharacterized protein n=1 Tax=Anas platyrhynchos TaxID=8839 RepID=R0M091_ANAPL|nr:hypothetical protein Anapl_02015 [Anas platyrhynchos]
MSRDNKPQLINEHNTYGTPEPRIETAPAGQTELHRQGGFLISNTVAGTRAAAQLAEHRLTCWARPVPRALNNNFPKAGKVPACCCISALCRSCSAVQIPIRRDKAHRVLLTTGLAAQDEAEDGSGQCFPAHQPPARAGRGFPNAIRQGEVPERDGIQLSKAAVNLSSLLLVQQGWYCKNVTSNEGTRVSMTLIRPAWSGQTADDKWHLSSQCSVEICQHAEHDMGTAEGKMCHRKIVPHSAQEDTVQTDAKLNPIDKPQLGHRHSWRCPTERDAGFGEGAARARVKAQQSRNSGPRRGIGAREDKSPERAFGSAKPQISLTLFTPWNYICTTWPPCVSCRVTGAGRMVPLFVFFTKDAPDIRSRSWRQLDTSQRLMLTAVSGLCSRSHVVHAGPLALHITLLQEVGLRAVTSDFLSPMGRNCIRSSWFPNLKPWWGPDTLNGSICTSHPDPPYSQKPDKEQQLVTQCSSVQATSPQCFPRPDFTRALPAQALSHTTSELSLSSSARALIADPAFAATPLLN